MLIFEDEIYMCGLDSIFDEFLHKLTNGPVLTDTLQLLVGSSSFTDKFDLYKSDFTYKKTILA